MTSIFSPSTNTYGEVTSWLPLTTIFTAPTECNSAFYIGTTNGQTRLSAWVPLVLNPDRLSCFPIEATSSWRATYPTTISLGPIVCPAQYTTANISTYTYLTPYRLSLEIACCPSNYDYIGKGFACISTVTSDQVFTVTQLSEVTYGRYILTNIVGTETIAVNAGSVFDAWQVVGDLPLTSTIVSSSSTSTVKVTTPRQTAPIASMTRSQGTRILIKRGLRFGILLLVVMGFTVC